MTPKLRLLALLSGQRNCIFCGAPISGHPNKRFCDYEHKKAYWRIEVKRRRDEGKETVEPWRVECPECGDGCEYCEGGTFTTTNPRAKYCSDRCRKRASRRADSV